MLFLRLRQGANFALGATPVFIKWSTALWAFHGRDSSIHLDCALRVF